MFKVHRCLYCIDTQVLAASLYSYILAIVFFNYATKCFDMYICTKIHQDDVTVALYHKKDLHNNT